MAQDNTKLCDFSNTNNNDFLSTPIAPLNDVESCEINTALLNLVMKDQFSGTPNEDVTSHLNTFVELCDMQNKKDVEDEIEKRFGVEGLSKEETILWLSKMLNENIYLYDNWSKTNMLVTNLSVTSCKIKFRADRRNKSTVPSKMSKYSIITAKLNEELVKNLHYTYNSKGNYVFYLPNVENYLYGGQTDGTLPQIWMFSLKKINEKQAKKTIAYLKHLASFCKQ